MDKLVQVINQQKGEIAALTCFVTALFASLPPRERSAVIAQLDQEAELARTMFLNSPAPDDVSASFEHHVDRFLNLE